MLRVFGPDGKRFAEVNSPNGDSGTETVRVAASDSGEYRLEIRALEKTAKPDGYEMKIEELLTADQYKERLAAANAQVEEVKKRLAKNAIRLTRQSRNQKIGGQSPLLQNARGQCSSS